MSRKKAVTIALIILAALVVIGGIGIGSYLYFRGNQAENAQETAKEAKQLQEELREGLVLNCEKNGNKLREVLQTRIHNEIKEATNFILLEKLFPNQTRMELYHLVLPSVRQHWREMKEVAPVDCNAIYPK